MKTGIFVAVLCFGAINLLAQPNNSSPKPESNSAGNSKATPTPEHNGIAAKDAESTKGSSPKGYASSEWMLVYIAALTGLAIAYQAREMAKTTEIIGKQVDLIKRQADIYDKQREIMEGQLGTMRGQLAEMNRQVVLQQTGMSQWVTFQGWRHKVRKNTGGDGVLEFNFDIVNPTNWPMNLVSTILRIRDRELMTNHFVPLLPKEPYTVGMSQIVIGQGGGYFEGGMTGFVLFGAIVYVDCFGNPQSQPFSGYLSCIEGGETNFSMEYFPENPYMKYQEKPKEADQPIPPSPAKSRDIPPN